MNTSLPASQKNELEVKNPMPNRRVFLAAVIILYLITAAFHIAAASKGWRIYRDQHICTALEYAKGNIDLMNPVVVGFNANNTPTPQEFPFWQATAAVLFKLFGLSFVWANVASLLIAATTIWPVFQLAKSSAGERAAWWTLLFFLSQPLIFYMSGRGGTDASCLTITVWFMYFADRMIRSGDWRWFVPAAAFGALSAITKAPFFFCAGLACFFLLLLHGKRSVVRWGMLAGVGVFAVLVFKLWSHHTDAVVANAEFPLVDLRVSAGEDGGKFMRDWLFGDMQYRLNPANWIKGGWRVMNSQFGSFALLGFLAWGLFRSKNRLGQFWLLAGFLTTLVFTHLVLHHSHYYLMISPAVALLCGVAAERLEQKLGCVGSERNASAWIVIGGSLVLLLLSTLQGLIGMKLSLDGDPYPGRMASVIRSQTQPGDKLLIQGGGWGGHLLFLSDRKGLSIWTTEFLEKPENLTRIKELGFTKLVMVSSSPMLAAVQQTNPGQSDTRRDSYRKCMTDVVNAWPTLMETEDVLIKEIPRATAAK